MDDRQYYTWQSSEVRTRRGTYTLFEKPGMARFGQPDIPASLLADELEVEPGESVLLLNCGAGLPGIVAAEAGAHVTMVDANVVAVEAARRGAEANGLIERVTVSPPSAPSLGGTPGLSGDASQSTHIGNMAQPSEPSTASPKNGGRGAEYDVAALLLPKGKAAALQSIWDAYQALKPGGRFFFAGANAEGAKTYIRYAEDLFGPIAVRAYRKGCRVGVAAKPLSSQPLPMRFQEPWLAHDYFQRFDVEIHGRPIHLYARPGVFSWDRLDAGTKALLDAMQIGVDDHVLDLGCGCGIVGVTAALLAAQGQVLMLDADINAVVSARQTVAANGVVNATVDLSDCAAVVENRDFDVVVTNPPFHQGKATQYDVAYQFIRDAARLLKPGGRFYLVANRFIPYEDAIRDKLGEVDTVYEDSRFKVLLGRQTLRQS